jgi:hypothetical protein
MKRTIVGIALATLTFVAAPLLFQVSTVTLLGRRPVNAEVAAGPMVASPDGGANWRFRLAATFLYPR